MVEIIVSETVKRDSLEAMQQCHARNVPKDLCPLSFEGFKRLVKSLAELEWEFAMAMIRISAEREGAKKVTLEAIYPVKFLRKLVCLLTRHRWKPRCGAERSQSFKLVNNP